MNVIKGMLRVLIAAACVLPALALAQHKDLEVVPINPEASVQLQIRINQHTVAIGDEVQFDFVSSADGYVTLWDVGTSGKVTRIYPNDVGGDMWVQAGVAYGAGGPRDRFAFQVSGPSGMEDVYLVWTRTAEAQPQQFAYGDAGALNKDLAVVERLAPSDWATAKVTFEITADGKPQTLRVVPPVARADAGEGRVFILAMGANVGELTKANADAQNFADTLQRLFAVPSNQVRVLKNAYKRDFAAGMEWLRQNAQAGDLVVIFFSGHGSTIADDDGDEADRLDEIYVTYDVQGSRYPSAEQVVRDDEFAAWIGRLPTDRVIAFIDACHSGGLRKSLTNGRTKFFVGGALGQPPAQSGWQQKVMSWLPKDLASGSENQSSQAQAAQQGGGGLLYAAAQENEWALEVTDGGLFVTQFLKQLSQAQQARLSDVFESTRQAVQRVSGGQQTPTAVGDTQLGQNLTLSVNH